MSATLHDEDGRALVRTRDGDLVVDVTAPAKPPPTAPAACPDCGLRRGRHIADYEIGGDNA